MTFHPREGRLIMLAPENLFSKKVREKQERERSLEQQLILALLDPFRSPAIPSSRADEDPREPNEGHEGDEG